MARTRTKILSELHNYLVDQGFAFENLRNIGTETSPNIEVVWGKNPEDLSIGAAITGFSWTEQYETTADELAAIKARLDALEAERL